MSPFISTSTTTFATSTTLSVLLHGAVLVGWLVMVEPFTATGQGLQIELVSADNLTNQAAAETQQVVKSEPVLSFISEHVSSEDEVKNIQKKRADKPELRQSVLSQQDDLAQDVITVDASSTLVASSGTSLSSVDEDAANMEEPSFSEKTKQKVSKKIVTPAQPVLSTNALQQQHSILELLHSRISDNKEYPYIARRQRREGVAKIGFVLNPDGSIHNARLVRSSHANVLDRAALSAVRAIEPFKPAQKYLEQAEAFEIDVVFQLL